MTSAPASTPRLWAPSRSSTPMPARRPIPSRSTATSTPWPTRPLWWTPMATARSRSSTRRGPGRRSPTPSSATSPRWAGGPTVRLPAGRGQRRGPHAHHRVGNTISTRSGGAAARAPPSYVTWLAWDPDRQHAEARAHGAAARALAGPYLRPANPAVVSSDRLAARRHRPGTCGNPDQPWNPAWASTTRSSRGTTYTTRNARGRGTRPRSGSVPAPGPAGDPAPVWFDGAGHRSRRAATAVDRARRECAPRAAAGAVGGAGRV